MDTNVLSRSDMDTLIAIQKEVQTALHDEEFSNLLEYTEKLNEKFIANNISPGGCADLLAVTLFIDSLFPGDI